MNKSLASFLPLDIPIIAQFGYLNDCLVKIPVLIREKDNRFFMKNPVKPNPEWQLNLIIRSIDFPEEHSIKLMKSPYGEMDIWESSVISKAGHSEYAEIYEIKEPKYLQITSGRKNPRIFCLVPVLCTFINSSNRLKATCVDISEGGLGLRFEGGASFNIGDICKISFDLVSPNLPELLGTIVRQSISALDRSNSIGIIFAPEAKENALKVLDFMSHRQSLMQQGNETMGFGNSRSGLLPKLNNINKEAVSLFNSDN
jgi:PilZ domain